MALKLGIDFDNTLVDYTDVFYHVAKELNWIDKKIATSKTAVKRYFLDKQCEEQWTELQGIVYGKEILRAKLYKNVVTTLKALNRLDVELCIVSHKTKYPVIGDKTDLHLSAQSLLEYYNLLDICGIDKSNIFFNETLEQKISKIAQLDCDFFIDDLPSVFQHPSYPKRTKRIIFDPDNHLGNVSYADFRVTKWCDVPRVINAR